MASVPPTPSGAALPARGMSPIRQPFWSAAPRTSGPYLKQPATLTPNSNPAASAGLHSSMSSYSLEQSYLHQNAREELSGKAPSLLGALPLGLQVPWLLQIATRCRSLGV